MTLCVISFLVLSVLLNLLTANQKTYSILVFVLQNSMRKLLYYHFRVGVVTCHWFCNKIILRFHRPGMKGPAAAEPELPIQKFNFVYFL